MDPAAAGIAAGAAVRAYRPALLAGALDLRAREDAIPFAGGTDLMVKHRKGAGALPSFNGPLLFLDRCPELRGIQPLPEGAGLRVGSMVTLAELADSPLVPGTLREVVLQIGGPALRSVATMGGNICNASPAADTLPFLYAWDATVALASGGGERTLSISDFITGPGRTALRNDEILDSILIPSWSPALSSWRKVGTRRANALTKVSLAAFADFGSARLALGAVAPTVVRLTQVESLLESALEDGRAMESIRARAEEAVKAAVRPIDDQRSTADYRRAVAVGLVLTFLEQAVRRSAAP
jgi:xanthine dehydrogenase FAD-binding subunit